MHGVAAILQPWCNRHRHATAVVQPPCYSRDLHSHGVDQGCLLTLLVLPAPGVVNPCALDFCAAAEFGHAVFESLIADK